MNKSVARQMLFVAVLAIGVAASGVLHAQTTTTTSYPVTETCSGGGQLCNNIASILVDTTGILEAQFVGGPLLCSSVKIHFLVDTIEVTATGFVGAGVGTGFFNLGPVSPGSHLVGLQAEGQVDGCNVGTLASWAGTAQITTSSPAVQVPTLSEWALVLLLAVLGGLGVLRTRGIRRRA